MLPLLQGTIAIIAVIKAGVASIAWQDGPTGGVGVAATTAQTAVADPVSSRSGDDSVRRRFRSTHYNDNDKLVLIGFAASSIMLYGYRMELCCDLLEEIES